MMKKVRVYDFESREMWIANDYEELSELFIALNTDDSIFSEPMQSTGLLDEKGNDVFEGDVVELHHFTENYSTTGGFYEGEESLVGVVRYGYTDDEIKYFGKIYPPRWFLENRYRKLDFSDLSGLHGESFKVIGDIYRNPELVEGL